MKPMLACEADLSKLKFPVLASPKLDGVRALIRDGVVLSRSLKPIPNRHVQIMYGRPELEGLDGELILGDPTNPETYRRTVSSVMSIAGVPNVDFHVFDRWNRDYPYNEVTLSYGLTIPVCSTLIHNMEELEDYEVDLLDKGYEGVMLRDPQSPYKFGRSTAKEGYLLKLKRFADSEAEIIEFVAIEELLPIGTLGALIVRDIHSGVEFKVGTGFTAAERQKLWDMRAILKGSLVKYRYFPRGSKEKPRFPSFLGFRNPIDL